jgi:uncharacterized membrane protein
MKRLGVVVILVLAFCGLADSVYLAQHEISGTPLICNIENLDGCNIVTNSPYSYLFGVPLAEYGVLFYAILFVLAALELVLFDRLLRRVLQGVAIFCVLASLYFVSIQVFFIGALCIYCVASAVITFLIFICATLIEPLRKRETPPVSPGVTGGMTQSTPGTKPVLPPEVPTATRLSMPPAA